MIEDLDLRKFHLFLIYIGVGGAAALTSEFNAITLLHLAGEWKAEGMNMLYVRTQAAYNSTSIAYGRNASLSFLKSPDPAGYVYI